MYLFVDWLLDLCQFLRLYLNQNQYNLHKLNLEGSNIFSLLILLNLLRILPFVELFFGTCHLKGKEKVFCLPNFLLLLFWEFYPLLFALISLFWFLSTPSYFLLNFFCKELLCVKSSLSSCPIGNTELSSIASSSSFKSCRWSFFCLR